VRLRFLRRSLLYAAPLLLFAPDALAWGLQTHVFFAQCALALLPFGDSQLRAAALRFPRLVLAGACLPDLALTGGLIGTPAFRCAHRWSTLRRLAAMPRDDADQALALGYASHLVTDVIAHNFFVPEHEARIGRVRHAVHALAEWAMDDYLRPRVRANPRELLCADHVLIAQFASRAFRCEEALAGRAVRLLGRADGALRSSIVPGLCRRIVGVIDRRIGPRFDAYVERATSMLSGIESAMSGGIRDWEGSDPEGHAGDHGADSRTGEHIARIVQSENHS
jgi:hypothetical protein